MTSGKAGKEIDSREMSDFRENVCLEVNNEDFKNMVSSRRVSSGVQYGEGLVSKWSFVHALSEKTITQTGKKGPNL